MEMHGRKSQKMERRSNAIRNVTRKTVKLVVKPMQTNLAAKKMLLRNLAAAKKKQKRNKNVTNA
jgi:hypothetical protein